MQPNRTVDLAVGASTGGLGLSDLVGIAKAMNSAGEQQNALNSGAARGGGTGGTGGGGVPQDPTRVAINNSFDTQISGLRDLLNAVPTQRQVAVDKVNNMYGSSQGQLTSARDRGFAAVDSARDRTQRDLDSGVRRLGDIGLQALRGFNNQLGTMGASNSSAAMLGSEAIGRDQTRLRSDLFNQAQDRFTDLDVTRSGIQSDYDLQLNELNTWKNNNILDITQQYEDLQRQIRQQMSVADADRQLALAELSQQLANNAASQIAAVTNDFQSAMGGLNRISNPTINTSRFNVQPLGGIDTSQVSTLNSTINPQNANTGSYMQAPTGVRQRDLLNSGISGLRVN